jgi:hypothetical protein
MTAMKPRGVQWDRLLTVLIMAGILGGFGGAYGWRDGDSLTEFVLRPHRNSVTLQPLTSTQHSEWRGRFAAACAFAGVAAAVAGGWIWPARPGRWATAAAALRVLLCSAVVALAMAAAAAHYRQALSQFIFDAANDRVRVRPQIWLTDLPIVRIPIIAGVSVLILAALLRALASRKRASARSRVSP